MHPVSGPQSTRRIGMNLSRTNRIQLLLLTHFAAILCLPLMVPARPGPRMAYLVLAIAALAIGQSLLCAAWCALGTKPLWIRAVFSVAAIGSLWTILSGFLWYNAWYASPPGDLTPYVLVYGFWFLFFPAVALYALLRMLSFWNVRLEHFADRSPPQTGLRFSSRLLLLLTLVVAGSLALKQLWAGPGSLLTAILVLHFHAACFVCVTLLILWAGLGIGHLWVRIPMAVVATFLIALLPAFYFAVSAEAFLLSFAFFGCLTFVVLGSLLVIRSCGYRLIRRETQANAELSLAH